MAKARAGRGGFTLVELLVVICIMAILAGISTVAIGQFLTSSRAQASDTMLQTMSAALAQYQVRWGDYPPSSLSEIGGRGLNSLNNGIESLVACLASKKRGPKLFEFTPEQLRNTDGDKAGSNLTDWYFGENDLWEYTDLLGFTIIYMHHRDYARPKPEHLDYLIEAGGEKVKIQPEKSEKTKTFYSSDKFQLRSVGPDGKPGSGDDLRTGGN